MRKLIYAILITSLLALPCFSQKADPEKEIARTQEFIAATQKKGNAKIDALKAYIKKFPETTSRWTRLAHYHLAVEHFQVKDYAGAVKYGDITLKLGSLSEGEEGRLYLIIANSYGIKSASIFNKDKALEYAQKAITFAQSKNLNDVLGEARKLKKQLSGPPPKKISPEQQIKMNYSDGDYSAAIAYYQKLGDADKANPEIHKTYANALFKASRWDSAIKEFKALLEKDKKGTYAFKAGESYAQKGKKNKSLYGDAVDFYLDAHLLYKKENSGNNAKVALSKAEYYLFEKYGFNAKIKKYNQKLQKQQSSSQKNESEIRNLKRELRKLERSIRREYEMEDLEPPRYVTDKVKELQKKIAALESGVTPQADSEGKELKEERNRIKAELNDLLKKAKERLGM
jgi:uncharacterized protein YdcH (DUF465 family)